MAASKSGWCAKPEGYRTKPPQNFVSRCAYRFSGKRPYIVGARIGVPCTLPWMSGLRIGRNLGYGFIGGKAAIHRPQQPTLTDEKFSFLALPLLDDLRRAVTEGSVQTLRP